MLDIARTALLASYNSAESRLLPQEIDRRRDLFLAKYSSEMLVGLAGSDLLRAVHGDGPRSGLFYDLEFAEDFAPFGGIGGGSALKFKVYAAGDGSGYKKKGKGNLPVPCTDAEAERMTAEIVSMLHKALLAVEEFRLSDGDAARWIEFERAVTEDIPPSLAQVGHDSPVTLLGWAHKYLAICRPDVFSFHHQPRQLANHLVRLGEEPDARGSRYLLDFQWRRLRSNDPDLHACHPVTLMQAAYDSFGNETKYWRIGTDEHNEHGQIDRWPAMQECGCASIGWSSLGDLKDLLAGLEGPDVRERIREALTVHEDDLQLPAQTIKRWASQVYDFYAVMSPGDRIAAMSGRQLQSVGEVTGEYEYDASIVHPHRRSVSWHDVPEEAWPSAPGLQMTIHDFTQRYADAVRVERLLSSSEPCPPACSRASMVREEPAPPLTHQIAVVKSPVRPVAAPLNPGEQRIKEILERKGQVILYGPPGTGKTYSARQTAKELLAREICRGQSWAMINERERLLVDKSIEFITFHPAYAYEDFIEGYRPAAAQSGGPSFELRDGLFLEICDRARHDPERHQILVIDEINRGNVDAIMGELITLLEYDKRDSVAAVLPLSRRRLRIPHNVWIIGTMNTADRSISLLDAALRRRFGFVEMLPDPGYIDVDIDGLSLSALLTEINSRIRKHVTRNARELQVGHAYFMRAGRPIDDKDSLLEAIRDEILPLLAEYCFENYPALARILGDEIIDALAQVPKSEILLDAERLHSALRCLVSADQRSDRIRVAEDGADTEQDSEAVTGHSAGMRTMG